jgi:hypothetical protein
MSNKIKIYKFEPETRTFDSFREFAEETKGAIVYAEVLYQRGDLPPDVKFVGLIRAVDGFTITYVRGIRVGSCDGQLASSEFDEATFVENLTIKTVPYAGSAVDIWEGVKRGRYSVRMTESSAKSCYVVQSEMIKDRTEEINALAQEEMFVSLVDMMAEFGYAGLIEEKLLRDLGNAALAVDLKEMDNLKDELDGEQLAALTEVLVALTAPSSKMGP